MNELFIVGDVAGRLEEMESLLASVPKEINIICVGDVIDKGPNSKGVLDYIIEHDVQLVLGNHEILLIKSLEEIESSQSLSDLQYTNLWLESRGIDTILSYHPKANLMDKPLATLKEFKDRFLRSGHLHFLISSPIVIYSPGLIISHSSAPCDWALQLIHSHNLEDDAVAIGLHPTSGEAWLQSSSGRQDISLLHLNLNHFVSYKKKPKELSQNLHIFGHNGRWGLRKFRNEQGKIYGISIDTSSKKRLTGIYWPSLDTAKVKNIS